MSFLYRSLSPGRGVSRCFGPFLPLLTAGPPGLCPRPLCLLSPTLQRGILTLSSLCLQHHMDPSSNFCNYRTALQGATQRSQTANSSREKIVIPVFNLFVKDIYFLHKIHTNHLPNGHINFKVSPTP